MQRLLQSVAKAIARQAREILERKAPVRGTPEYGASHKGEETWGFGLVLRPSGPFKSRQKSLGPSGPLGAADLIAQGA